MRYVVCFALVITLLVLPVFAADATTATTPIEDTGEYPALYAADGGFTGGYYFVADCILGTGLKFYVPADYAYDCFTIDSTGSMVNMTNSTCYVYCPSFPDYTFSASRFGTFYYRGDGYNSSDLALTNVTDTNMELLLDEAVRPSDSQLLTFLCFLLFAFLALFLIHRR